MEFHKYPHFENEYKEKELAYWLRNFPEIKTSVLSIQEKLHGVHMSVTIHPEDTKYLLASRTQVIPDDQDFHTARGILHNELQYIWSPLDDYSQRSQSQITLYGEIIGDGVIKANPKVQYGPKSIRFYGMRKDEILLSQKVFQEFMNASYGENTTSLCVPFYGLYQGLDAALAFDTRIDSRVLGIENNLIEGVVIKTYHNVIVDAVGKTFMLKKKNPEFLERSKPSKEKKEIPETIVEMQKELLEDYINMNRVTSAISKFPEFTKKQFGTIIQEVIRDIREDARNDERFTELSKDEDKHVWNIGKHIVPYLQEYLNNS